MRQDRLLPAPSVSEAYERNGRLTMTEERTNAPHGGRLKAKGGQAWRDERMDGVRPYP